MPEGDTPQRVAIVTGCSTGIGRASALALHDAGILTVATARDVGTLDDLSSHGCEVATLDVTNAADRERLVADVLRRHGHVDVLVNNAGYAEYGALEEVGLDRWRAQFETNVYGLVAMTQLVVPSMRDRHWGRIINVSSMGGIITLPLGSAYHASKWAVEALSDVARLELGAFGIDVVVVEPGVVLSNFAAPAHSGINLSTDSPYFSLSQAFSLTLHKSYEKKHISNVRPERIAKVIARAAASRRPRTRYRVGVQARALIMARRVLSDRAYDAVVRSQIR